MVAPFGNALHVSGTDRAALDARRSRAGVARRGYDWREVAPSLEDVFIHLMRDLARGRLRAAKRP